MYRFDGPSIYDPATYPQGVPNPLGPRVHAWKGGPLNEGTRYHGPVYTRPMATFPWHERPLWTAGPALAGNVFGYNEDKWDGAKVGFVVGFVAAVGAMAAAMAMKQKGWIG